MRTTSGVGADATGGDFRFQGQWLESATGLYNFRARDYDSRTGTFLSRDPVDSTQQDPEALNPYQAMYNNPYVYSDPSGEITISELNVTQAISNILDGIYKNNQQRIARKAINEAKGVATDIFTSAAKKILPWSETINIFSSSTQGSLFERFMQKTACSLMSSVIGNFADYLWLEVGVDSATGAPQNNGRFRCAGGSTEQLDHRKSPSPNYSNPDFVIKKGGPASTSPQPFPPKGDPALLIGDFKRSLSSIKTSGKDGNQWKAIMKYARGVWQYPNPGQQYIPVALYVTLYGDDKNEKKLQRKAINSHGVRLEVLSFIDRN